jgi:hypothetical protein
MFGIFWKGRIAALRISLLLTLAISALAARAAELPIPDQANAIALREAKPSAPAEQWESLYGDLRRIRLRQPVLL